MNLSNWNNLNLDNLDTPALIVDKDLVNANIDQAIKIIGNVENLRPHVKTHKMLEVAKLQKSKGISKFKCATIAEAEMLGMAKVEDVLIAYPLQGPKILRFIQLQKKFPNTKFSFLVDNIKTVLIANTFSKESNTICDVYIDINNGQNRTGIKLEDANTLVTELKSLKNINLIGVHCYDGHIRMPSLEQRIRAIKDAFVPVIQFKVSIEKNWNKKLKFIAGGSPSFPVHARFHDVECSPGTWIFWDARYGADYPEQEFKKAAVVATRVISQLDDHTYCLDLGHKSIASESPFPRVEFTENINCKQIGHSEEHLIIKCANPNQLDVGQILTAFPFHICPTVALYDEAQIVSKSELCNVWKVTARNRKISI